MLVIKTSFYLPKKSFYLTIVVRDLAQGIYLSNPGMSDLARALCLAGHSNDYQVWFSSDNR